MKTRIVMTLIVTALFILIMNMFGLIYSPLTGAATAAQFNDNVSSYSMAKFIRDGGINKTAEILFIIVMIMIWINPVINMIKTKKKVMTVFAFAIAALFASCTPYKTLDVVEVKSNETAWAIPLDAMSQNGQVKFNSVDFLNQKKIAAKRIMIDKVSRSTGRMYWDMEWLPATRIITIDRSLVTREWTDGEKGTNRERDEGIGVVTKDSVKLRIGLTITASIDEDDASTYLYYHGARKLSEVLDQNIRSFAVSELTKEYSQRNLSDAQTKSDEIYAKLFADAARVFKAKGITIQYLGNAEGLTYADQTVQQAINARYLAEQDVKTAEQQQNAQRIRNSTSILNAQTQADAAKKLLEAKEATSFQNELQINLLKAQAQMKMADKWNGGMPSSILPSNSPLLLNLGEHSPANAVGH